MSTNDKLLPPGKPLSKNNIVITKLDASISFSFDSTSVIPLSPVVQTSFNGDALQVSAVVFIPSAIENPNFNVINKKRITLFSGEDQLNFYITYDDEEISSQTFNAYRVDFTVKNPPRNLVQIQTFLWDEDPVTSRGTRTATKKRQAT